MGSGEVLDYRIRIADIFHDDNVFLADSRTTHVQLVVTQDLASAGGRR